VTTREQELEAMRSEREATLGRINALFGRLRLDAPPSFTPYTASTADPTQLLKSAEEAVEAVREEDEAEDACDVLESALSAFTIAQAGASEYDEQSMPVVVISMAGLRRLEAIFTELEQLRGQVSS
jgi:hypothetical protein